MLNLFILKSCPYCHRVVEYLETTKLKYKLLDISDEHNLMELMQMGGKRQVPFLFDSENNVTMYESKDIVEYLKTLE